MIIQKDYAIVYTAKLSDIENHLQKLENIDIEIADFKKAVESIKKEVKTGIKTNYEALNEVEQAKQLNNANASTYSLAAGKLAEIDNQILDAYNVYYKINVLYKNLQRKAEKASEDNIAEICSDCRKMLTGIRSSSNVEYSMEEKLVENIYKLVYKVIKLELIYSNSAGILYYIKNDSTDSHYISELMEKDIETLDGDKQEVKMLKEKIDTLEENGLNDMFLLDRDVMTLLAIATDENLNIKIKEQFLYSLENHQILAGDCEKKENVIKDLTNTINELKRNLNLTSLKIFKRKLFLL